MLIAPVSPQAFRVGAFGGEKLRSVARQLRDICLCVVELRMPHPSLEAGQEDAAADRVNEKTVPDALGRGMRSSGDPGLGDHRGYLGKQRLSGLGPDPFVGLKTVLGAADAMHRVEKIDEGVRDGARENLESIKTITLRARGIR
jgi:hypothetical protein